MGQFKHSFQKTNVPFTKTVVLTVSVNKALNKRYVTTYINPSVA